MFSRLRKRHGAALPVAVLALIVAVAFAGVPAVAAPVANTSASLVKKVAVALKLSRVANKKANIANKRALAALKQGGQQGPAGPEGPQGPKGDKGDTGSNGADGSPGAPGKDGDDGTSVTSTEFEGEFGPCENGGSEFTSASGTTYACNGGGGGEGEGGLPAVLPSGSSLSGVWQLTANDTSHSISFAVPLSENVPASIVPTGGPSTENCPGTAAEPEAASGRFCVYQAAAVGTSGLAVTGPVAFPPISGHASRFGAVLSATETTVTNGTWAVTAP